MNSYQISQEEETQTTQIYSEAQKGRAYLMKLGLTKVIPLCVDYYEGNQHSSKATKETQSLPRIIVNFVRKNCDIEIANIMSKKYKLNFRSDIDTISLERWNSFVSFTLKNMDQERLDYELIKSGVVKGTYVGFYYWDKKAIGQCGNYEGAISGEVLDPLRTYFADPTEKDVQKQEYIIYEHKESVKSVRNMCDKKDKRVLIIANGSSEPSDYRNDNEEDNGNVVVYTKFFRINDEVYYQNATKEIVLHVPKPINPRIVYQKMKQSALEKQEAIMLDGKDKNELVYDGKRLSMPTPYEPNDTTNDDKCIYYPFIVGSFISRENSIYGISEVEGVRGIQKSINMLYSFAVASAQKQGVPKMVAKKGALAGQKPSNSIDEILIDNTPIGAGDGIKYLQVQPFTQGGLQLAPTLADAMKNVSNASELLTGDTLTKELSGTAISLATANSDKAIEPYRKNYWRSLEKLGRILEQYFKHQYNSPKQFEFEISDKMRQDLQKEDEQAFIRASQNGMEYTPKVVPKYLSDEFSSEEYNKSKFALTIEAGEGTQYNEAQSMYMLNNLLANKMIDTKLYVKLYPTTGIPFKGEMLDEIEKREQEEVMQLRHQVAEMQQQLQDLSNYSKTLEKSNKDLLSNLNENNIRMETMRKEYRTKIEQANALLTKTLAPKQGDVEKYAKEQNKGIN